LSKDDITIGNTPNSKGAPSEVTTKEIYISSGLIRTVSARNASVVNLIGAGMFVNVFWVVFASALYPYSNLIVTVPIGLVISLLIA
jgi:hypothetical protein